MIQAIVSWYKKRQRIKEIKSHITLLTGFISEYPASPEIKRNVWEELLHYHNELLRLEK